MAPKRFGKHMNKKIRFNPKNLGYLLIFCLVVSVLWVNYISLRHAKTSAHNQQPRLVIIYAPCTVNKDYLSVYNADRSYTPHLKEFAKKAAVFLKHRTEAGHSGVAYASLLTGHHADVHGVFIHPAKISQDLYDMSEAFSDNGYEIFYWNKKSMADHDYNYIQAAKEKNVYSDVINAKEDTRLHRILDCVKDEPGYKAFIFANFSVSHFPYNTSLTGKFYELFPQECEEDFVYDEETHSILSKILHLNKYEFNYGFPYAVKKHKISPRQQNIIASTLDSIYKSRNYYLDKLFGDVLDVVKDYGLMDESLIVFTADHGEVLYDEHAPFKWTHGNTVQSEDLDIPLLIFSTNEEMGPKYIDHVSRSIDVFPTIASLAGIRLPDDLYIDGFDWTPSLRGKQPYPNLLAYSHSAMLSGYAEKFASENLGGLRSELYPEASMDWTWVSVRDGDIVTKYKNLGNGKFGFESFDLSKGKNEVTNIYDESLHYFKNISSKLLSYRDKLIDAYHASRGTVESEENDISKDEGMKRLRSLGYLQ